MAEALRMCRQGKKQSVSSAHCDNLLLRSLEPEAFASIRPHLEHVRHDHGRVIITQGDSILYVWFPECGVASIADVLPDGTRAEVALIGREGMTNSHLLLGCDHAAHEVSIQIGGGRSLGVDGHVLRQVCVRHASAHRLFLRYIHALSVQTSRTLASNLRDPAIKRLSRWLLMCHDRVDGDEILVGHQHISQMLGVRRATITDTLHVLEGQRTIRGGRGKIIIRDRSLLEEVAGTSYGLAETEYRKLIGSFGKGAGGTSEVQHSPLSSNGITRASRF